MNTLVILRRKRTETLRKLYKYVMRQQKLRRYVPYTEQFIAVAAWIIVQERKR